MNQEGEDAPPLPLASRGRGWPQCRLRRRLLLRGGGLHCQGRVVAQVVAEAVTAAKAMAEAKGQGGQGRWAASSTGSADPGAKAAESG